MKKYIALKAMKFDKYYQKGDSIPENVIAKDMINKLLRCGVLAKGGEIEQNPEEQIPEQSEIEQQKNQNTQDTTQTEQELLQYKKEELEQMAEQKGIEVKQGMTKADIIALLLQKE